VCGIVGLVNYERRYRPEQLRSLTLAMREALRHRGPDDAGLWQSNDGLVCLGHRRLAIVDLRPEGRQPLLNEDGSVAVTFNGEIYNYRALTRRLEAAGHRFATRTDTETLCHLFEGDPDRAVADLEGMFAFAVWRSHSRELVLARDPLGKKPLYYGMANGLLAFASELTALEQVPGLCTAIDKVGVQHYLLLQFVHPPYTIYQACRKLAPGSILRVRLSESGLTMSEPRRFFNFQPREPAKEECASPRQESRALEALRGHVVAAVSDRLMGDVPLGAFLSGGIDSSLVVAVMVKELGIRPRTFSIGFTGADGSGLADSEHLAARRIAQALGTDHNELLVSPSAVDLLPTIVAALDEPNGDSSCLPVYLLSEFTRKQVTVALSGDGGDEMFGGYRRYGDTLREARNPWRFYQELRHFRRWWRPARAYLDVRACNGLPQQVLERMTGPVLPEVRELMRGWRRDLNAARSPLIHRMRAYDVEAYLPGAVLAKVDRMSMRFALEVRCPLLDVRLARWAAKLPARWCHDQDNSKVLLKKLAARYLPADIVQRPKMGFGLPEQYWAKESLLNLAHDLLLGQGSKVVSYVDRQGLRQYLQEQSRSFSIYQVWGLLVLESWLRKAAQASAIPLAA
jgi:asparagine synthase (glutamine-hydrolysing)